MSVKSMQTVFACSAFCAGAALLLGLSPAARAADDKTPHEEKARYGDQQPLFDRINVLEAWEITKGDPDVRVGVIDNGYDFFHPDLKGQLVPGYYFASGYHTEFAVCTAHGTLVSSIIVAKDNGAGMVGLAPHCKVLTASQGTLEHLMFKIQQEYMRDHPEGTLAEVQAEMQKHQEELQKFGLEWVRYQHVGAADAIRYLVDHGARVINFSGGVERSLCPSAAVWKKVEDAFAYAAEKNVVIVVGAGNNALRWEGYPGKADSMLVAGASLLDDTRWEEDIDILGTKIKHGSHYGNRLTVMAPVDNMMVCAPHEERCYDVKDGPMGPMKDKFEGPYFVLPIGATSAAAPIVSSLVALMLSANPDLDAKSVVEIIKQGCDDIGEPGYDEYTGYGRVNFGKTVKLAVARKQE